MFNRCIFAAATLAIALCAAAVAADDPFDRTIVLVAQPPFKNPGVLTLGTLSIANRIDFAFNAITSNGNKAGGKLTVTWDWGDGTPPGSGLQPNHTYLVAGNYTVTVTATEAGNPTPSVFKLAVAVTDAIKSSKLQTNEMWSKQNSDSFSLAGTVRIPNVPLKGQLVFCDIGGVQLSFTLNDKGVGTVTTNANAVTDASGVSSLFEHTCKASLKVILRKRPKTNTFVDSKFMLKFAGSVQDAFAFPALITNRDASRDNVRVTCKMTFNPPEQISILYQSGINQLFTSKKGQKGKTR